MSFGRLSGHLGNIGRCPHCGVARPQLKQIWVTDRPINNPIDSTNHKWATYHCTSCGGLLLAKGSAESGNAHTIVEEIFPTIRMAAVELPDTAKKYLQQAYESLHAPDAAALMAGSAVDAMLKESGYIEGSLYGRIDKAVSDNFITKAMGEWAHSVRLGSNRPRHANNDSPHVTPAEAKQSVEFADALGQFLFVLTARIQNGIENANKSEA